VVVGAVAAAVLVGLPGAAFAHGIDGSGDSVADFAWLGTKHMLLGWDHLLFVAGVVLLAGEAKPAAKLISLFALGHSTTLIAATLAGWRINATAVDIVIALSVVFVGVVGWFGRPARWRWFAVAVFGFGLVHGLGLSTRLQALGLHDDGLLARVIAFNVGVEIGQLLAVVAMFIIGDVLRHYLRWPHAQRAANVGLVLAGLVAASVLAIPTTADDPPAVTASSSCQVRDSSITVNGRGGHPSKDFYEPTETAPADDFSHVLGDGYLIVYYPPTLTTEDLSKLRAFITGSDGVRVSGGAAPGQAETLKAVRRGKTLTCTELDLPALKDFKKTWFNDPRSRPPE